MIPRVTIPGAARLDRPTPVRLFDLTDGWEPPRYSAQKTPTDLLGHVQYTPDQSVLCTRTSKGFIGVWELSTHREIGRLDISGDRRTTVFDSGKQLLRVSKRLIEL